MTFVLLGQHGLWKPPPVSQGPRRPCHSQNQTAAVPTPQHQDLHKVPHAAEHGKNPNPVPVRCWMYSPNSTQPAVLQKEIAEALRDTGFPMPRCLQLCAVHVFPLLSVTWNVQLYCLWHICHRMPNLLQETFSELLSFLWNPWHPTRFAALHQYSQAHTLVRSWENIYWDGEVERMAFPCLHGGVSWFCLSKNACLTAKNMLCWWSRILHWFSQVCMDIKVSPLKMQFRGSKLNKT